MTGSQRAPGSESGPPTRLLILGLGNILCQDDGVGTAAVEMLRRTFVAPDEVQVLDGGTLGLSLIPYMEDADEAILIDAIRDDAQPGTLVRLEGDEVRPAVEDRLSVHQVGVADVFAGLELLGRVPRRVVLWGIVPRSLNLGLGCTLAVEARLPQLVHQVVAEAQRMGHVLRPRRKDELAAQDPGPVFRGRRLGL